MWDTMQQANGCGLAACQVGVPLQLFIVDSRTTFEHMTPEERTAYFDEGDKGIRETFINAVITGFSESGWQDEEGCLSIPGLQQPVQRSWGIAIHYLDAGMQPQVKYYTGLTARMIQHEYDHTKGILYPDRITPLARRLLQPKLKKIMNGKVKAAYKLLLPGDRPGNR